MRKNVEPQTAVTLRSSAVASRARPAGADTTRQTIVTVMVLPLGAWATRGVTEADRPEEAAQRPAHLHREPRGLEDPSGFIHLLAHHVGDVHEDGPLGDDEPHGVAAEEGAVPRLLPDDRRPWGRCRCSPPSPHRP